MENNAKRKHICDLCEKNKFFEIPPYQRLYEWGENEISELLNDMKNAFCEFSKNKNDKNKEYFIGTITTSEEDGKFKLIDGQQRLTTLWFIGFYLASQKCGEWQKKWQEFIISNGNLRIAMPIRDDEERALRALADKISKSNGESDKDKNNSLADYLPNNIHKKINEAFKCIESWFENVDKIKENEIKDFADFIYEKVCFVFVTLAENTDLNRFFVRMNNRGKQLEKHEILKARLLDVIQKSGSDKNEWQQYAKIWDLCSDMDKYIFQSNGSETYQVESIIDFPTFLLHCYKLWAVGQENEKTPQEFQINKDKLLDMINPNKWNGDKAKCFIKSMLRYRVFFDSFVIKFTAKIDKDINDKESSYKIKRLGSNSTYIVNSDFKDLEMIQNYLRVARRGTNQNYEHWLTDFLHFLDSEKEFSEIKNFATIGNFFEQNNKIKDKLNLPQCLIKQEYSEQKNDSNNKMQNSLEIKLVKFLEKIDTQKICEVNLKDKKLDDISIDFLKGYLSKGTTTPHYWFYRLEYYLWKNGIQNGEDLQIGDKKFSEIRKNFYFRNLNSIEHIHPRSIDGWGEDNGVKEIDKFGNLALLSIGFNSSLNDNIGQEKYNKLLTKVQKDDVESLKLWLVYAEYYDKDKESWKWNKDEAQIHQKTMLEILKQSLN